MIFKKMPLCPLDEMARSCGRRSAATRARGASRWRLKSWLDQFKPSPAASRRPRDDCTIWLRRPPGQVARVPEQKIRPFLLSPANLVAGDDDATVGETGLLVVRVGRVVPAGRFQLGMNHPPAGVRFVHLGTRSWEAGPDRRSVLFALPTGGGVSTDWSALMWMTDSRDDG